MINNLNEGVAVAAFMEGVSFPYYLITLVRMAPKTKSGLLEEVNKQIRVKETLQGRNMSCLSALLPSSKCLEEHNSPHDQEKWNKKDKDKSENTKERPRQQFTPLTVPLGGLCPDGSRSTA